MLIDFVCFMQFHGRTINLESMCGRNPSNVVIVQSAKQSSLSEAQQRFLEGYRLMAMREEDLAVENMMLNRLQTQTQGLLNEGENVCLPSSDNARERAYMARVTIFNSIGGLRGKFLLINNRVVYVLARTYLCN